MKILLSPLMRVMFLVIVVIGFALLIVEQFILYILIPFAWILFGNRSNEIYKTLSRMTAKEYRDFKGLRKESLRDNMSDVVVTKSSCKL